MNAWSCFPEKLHCLCALDLASDAVVEDMLMRFRRIYGPMSEHRGLAFSEATVSLGGLKTVSTKYIVLSHKGWTLVWDDMFRDNGFDGLKSAKATVVGISCFPLRREFRVAVGGEEVRTVQSEDDCGSWYFRSSGVPFRFENTDELGGVKKRNRLLPDRVKEYFKWITGFFPPKESDLVGLGKEVVVLERVDLSRVQAPFLISEFGPAEGSVDGMRSDEARRRRLIERLRKAGDSKVLVVSLEEFFQGNEDLGSIGCNLHPHPGLMRFFETLWSIRNDAAVRDVLVEIHEVPDEEDVGVWPYSEAIYVIASCPITRFTRELEKLGPSEVEESKEGIPETLRVPRGFAAWRVWWD